MFVYTLVVAYMHIYIYIYMLGRVIWGEVNSLVGLRYQEVGLLCYACKCWQNTPQRVRALLCHTQQ